MRIVSAWKIPVLAVTACVLVAIPNALAAIAIDATSQATDAGINPLTFNHTIGSGANRLLVVSVTVEHTTNFDVIDVTYDGVSLTPAVEHNVGSTTFMNAEIWYMVDANLPAAGTYTVAVTTSGVASDINAGAVSVFGALQQAPEASAFADDGEAAAATIQQTITTLTDGAWIFDAVGSGEATTFTPDAGQTEFFDVTGTSSGGAGSYEEKATAGAETQGWTRDGVSNRLAYVLAAFAPAPVPPSPVYYSIGTSVADLKNGTPTVTISSGVATFTTAQPDNVGVGDEITYNGGTRAYISARTSSTVYSVTTATGGVPADIAGATVNSILRAFNSLDEATSGSADASHLNTTDLVSANIQLNWAAYNDGPDTVAAAIQEPWVTGPGNYIRLFTPVGASEVGVSQRHDGTAGTGYRLAPVASPGVGTYRILQVSTDTGHVRIEGIEIDGSNVTNAEVIMGINLSDSSGSFDDARVSHSLIHDITNSTVDDSTQSDVWGLRWGEANDTKIWNNIIYDITNVSTHASSDAKGMEADTGATASYVYNNTVYNVLNTGSAGEAVGIEDDVNNTINAKNNFVGLVDSTSGFEACFAQTFASQSNNVSSDGTAVGATGQTSYATYFESVTPGSEDFHLRSDSFSLWGIDGADLDADPNLPVTDDIDGQSRDASAPDIGADELDVTPVFYSIGTSVSDLKSGTPTMTMTNGVATLTVAQPDNVGLGDEVSYNGGTIAYISERMSSTVYRLSTPTGTAPADEGGATVDSITRAFNTLASANAGSKDASHLNASDLTTAKRQLNWVFYNDGPLDEAEVDIDGWTTGPDHYIRLFTPTAASEVGVSQRHTGVAGTGFRFAPVNGAPPLSHQIITFYEEYVRVEGIEFDGSGITNAHALQPLRVETTVSPTSDLRFEGLLVHDFENSDSVNPDRDVFAFFVRGGSTKLSNSIFYDFALLNTDVSSDVNAIRFEGTGTHFVHNVTVYDVKNLANANTARGIQRSSSTVTVRNSAVFDVDSTSGPEECFSGTLTQSNNVSSDTTAAGASSVTNQTDYSTYFVSVAPGSEDLHLTADSSTLWATVGADLDADPDLPVTEDIDGDARHASSPDIGADETAGSGAVRDVYYSVGTSAADMKTGSPTISISSGTATLSVAQTGNIGLGDEIDYGAGLLGYIHAVTSQTEFEVRTATGTLPPNTGAVAVNSIVRTFGTLSGAESASAGASYLNTTDLIASNVKLTWVVYDDGALVDSVTVDGYLTDATHHIAITVPGSSQVASGVSQRHDGTAGTGARMTPVSTATHAIFLADPYTRVEWLELDGSTVTVTGSDGVETGVGGDDATLQNLLIHHWDESFDDGIWINVPNVTVRNTILHDNEGSLRLEGDNAVVQNVTIYNGAAYGVLVNGSSGHTIENVIAMASAPDFSGPGPVTANNNLSSDATADDWGGTGHLINQVTADQFVDISGPIDLHLKAGSDAIDAGVDRSGSFTSDIDGQTRPLGTQWDMGADETAAATFLDVYYSVGASVADLKTGSPTISIAAGTATLSVAQTGNIGLGDEIDYGAGLKAYIHGVVSPTVFDVRTAIGQIPPDTGAVTVNSIGRTFNTLTDAEINSPGASYIATNDLVAADVRLTWVAYDDADFTEELAINGYNTSTVNTLTLTVAGASQVVSGVSQRHTGTAGTGVVLKPQTLSVPGLLLQEPFVRVEWLELDGSDRVAASNNVLVLVDSAGPNADLRNLLVHDTSSGGSGDSDGIRVFTDSVRIRNSIVYDVDDGLDLDGAGVTVANVTVFGAADEGVQSTGTGTTVTLENVISMGSVSNDFQEGAVGQFAVFDNNMSSDASAGSFGGTGNLASQVAADEFVSIVAGSEDLHLKAGADAIDAGLDRSDSFTDDIDGDTRAFGTGWDIGADETLASSVLDVYYSVGTSITNLMTGSPNITIVNGTATLDVSQTGNVGLGDVITFAGTDVYIHRVTSQTEFEVRTVTGAIPANVGSTLVSSIGRVFNSWQDAVNSSGTAPYLGSFDLTAANARITWVGYNDGAFTEEVAVDGYTTDATRYLKLSVAGPGQVASGVNQRHDGTAGTGTAIRPQTNGIAALAVRDSFTRVEWLELDGSDRGPATNNVGVDVETTGDNALLQGLLIHHETSGDQSAHGVVIDGNSTVVRNNIIYEVDDGINTFGTGVAIKSTTIYAANDDGMQVSGGTATLENVIAMAVGIDFFENGGTFTLVDNCMSDNGSADDFGGSGNLVFKAAVDQFVSITPGSEDLHLKTGADALDTGKDLSGSFNFDIDGGLRQTPWDIGADDFLATTAVELIEFEAIPLDGAVELRWETGSELDNLGFHLYRSLNAGGPYERITTEVIPGLGSSPEGARYTHRDDGLANGTTYYYQLEDIETTGVTEMHGPVSATPEVGATLPEDGERSRITFGEPSANAFRVLRRSRNAVTLELVTEGFYAVPQEDGSMAIEIPGLESSEGSGPALPVKHHWVDAVAGQKVKLRSLRGRLEAVASGWSLSSMTPELVARSSGTVQARRRRHRMSSRGDGLFPMEGARIVTVAFQGESKKALVELAPLRWAPTGELYLARRLVVQVSFRGLEPSERGFGGGRGRRRTRELVTEHGVLARLSTTERGLHGVRYEDIFGARGRIRVDELRLSRQGEDAAFHIEPASGWFRRGSMLYFVSAGADANPYGHEAVYELQLGTSEQPGTRMEPLEATPRGAETTWYWKRLAQEVNQYHQAGLVDAPDSWLWDLLLAPVAKSYPFEVTALAQTVESARLEIWLQGTSDSPANPDHHVRVYVNGSLLAESSWNGKAAQKVSAELLPGVLVEGANVLELENVGDTEATFSTVMLDRFAVTYPRRLVMEAGIVEGRFGESGTASLESSAHVLETSGTPRWLGTFTSFGVEAGRSYLAVEPGAVHSAEVRKPTASSLTNESNQADYIIIGPRDFVRAAEPLLVHRAEQGLVSKGVAIEDVFAEFGHGESTPEAIRRFLTHAFHEWRAPSIRYVVLLGDGSYDYKDYAQLGASNPVPPLMVRTSYLWTASDPTLAAVNGNDLLPDIAIGRLPAASVEDVHTMVSKILAWESRDYGLRGPAILVADNPDSAGDFVSDAEAAARRLPEGTDVTRIYLSELGASATTASIIDAFDGGASLMSYLGHGGIHLWGDENVFNTGKLKMLAEQERQPLLLTMNCLNGYFHFPYFGALAEELVKAENKGVIAAFSPSGLSLNDPAQQYHRALLEELFSGEHVRLGDAVLGAQERYLATGAFPELLSIYHLFGDPALAIR